MTDVKLPDSFLSDFYLGRCNYDEEYSCSSPESKFTDLNIWDRLLSTQDLLDWTTCRYVKHMLGRFSICRSSLRSFHRNMNKGNIVNWETAKLILTNMTEIEVPEQEVCEPARPGDVLIPSKVPFTDLVELCKVFNAKTTVVSSSKMQAELVSVVEGSDVCADSRGRNKREKIFHFCLWHLPKLMFLGFWNGWWDKNSEGDFVNVNNQASLSQREYQPWYMGEPNGKDQENCAQTSTGQRTWNDIVCSAEQCGFCHLSKAPSFTLRGVFNF